MKTTTSLMIFAAVAIGLAAAGCSSSSSCADGGTCGVGGNNGGGGAGGSGMTFFGLTEGTYCFDITTVTVSSDTCDAGIAANLGQRVPVTYSTATGVVTVG